MKNGRHVEVLFILFQTLKGNSLDKKDWLDKTFYLVYASPHINVSGLCFVTTYTPNNCNMYLRL